MNFYKRCTFCLVGMVILLLTTAPALRAQTTFPDSINQMAEKSQQIAWNFFRLIGGNANHFSHYKGNLIEKLNSGISAYKVNELEPIGVDNEFIMVKPDGATFYWAHITGDETKLKEFYVAFTTGVSIYGNKNNLPVVSKRDLTSSTNDVGVYNLMVNDLKVGTFTEDKNKKTINIMIGLFN